MPPRTAAVNALNSSQEADEEVDHAVVERRHQAGDRSQGRPHDEGLRDRAVDVDAAQTRHQQVLLAGALGAAERGAADQIGERDHQHEREQDHDDLDVADGHREAAGVAEHEAAGDHRRQRLDVGALGQLDVVLEEDRHADRRDQRRQPERAAQWPVGDALDRPAVGRGEGHRDQQDQDQGERHPGDAEDAEQGERDDRKEGADHVDLAVGEIDHADDAVNHAVADRDQPVHGAERHAVDQLLQEIRHPCRCAL